MNLTNDSVFSQMEAQFSSLNFSLILIPDTLSAWY